MDCCKTHEFDYDLAIVGSGSAAFAAAIKASELNKTVLMIEKSELGGTCVNFGCVPSKTLIRAAEAKHKAEHFNFKGLSSGPAKLDFEMLINEKQALVESLQKAKYQSVLEQYNKISFMQGHAQFQDANRLKVDGKIVSAEKIIIATGSHAVIPPVEGIDKISYLTSKEAFELDVLPETLAVVGGGYIALEIAQMFSRLGSKVTIIQRSEILFQEDDEVSKYMTDYLRSEGIEILNHTSLVKVQAQPDGVKVLMHKHEEQIEKSFSKILFATGRKANTNGLSLESAGVQIDKNGNILINEYGQTNIASIYAAGDVTPTPALVYVAAYEGNLAAENAILGNRRKSDLNIVPWVIFTDPQVCGVGVSEAQAKASNIEYDVSTLTLDNVPRSIAARDTRGFIKLLRRTGTDQLIGARIVASEGSELLMELSLIMKYNIPLSEVGKTLHPYLTLSEGIKLAVQAFDKDVKSLSCCAS
jgi:mercuric reductase